MKINRITPDLKDLVAAGEALRTWQRDDTFQLHPGDIGWYWRFGPDATARAVRLWRSGEKVLALGLLDGPGLLRLAIDPDLAQDEELAHRLSSDLTRVDPGLLGPGEANLEAPAGVLIHDMLTEAGWGTDEPWTPLRRDLSSPADAPGVRVEVVGSELAAQRTEVQRAAFEGSSFTTDRWVAMAAGPLYREARCLLAFEESGAAVATITVWSAGPGRPGLIEPMGVHRDHRGKGHGVAICRAGLAALREMGSSCATVCTPSSNLGAVATYRAASLTPLTEQPDRRRGNQAASRAAAR